MCRKGETCKGKVHKHALETQCSCVTVNVLRRDSRLYHVWFSTTRNLGTKIGLLCGDHPGWRTGFNTQQEWVQGRPAALLVRPYWVMARIFPAWVTWSTGQTCPQPFYFQSIVWLYLRCGHPAKSKSTTLLSDTQFQRGRAAQTPGSCAQDLPGQVGQLGSRGTPAAPSWRAVTQPKLISSQHDVAL